MSDIIEITELSDPALAVYTRLTAPELRRRWEGENGLFIAESPNAIGCALDAGCRPVSLLMERRHLTGSGAGIIARCPGIPVYTGDREVLSALTGYALTRGVLCAMRRPAERTVEEVCANASRLAVMEDIVDVTNLGAIFRSAAALGMDGVLLSPSCCDPLARRSVRVSMGTVFLVPWARFPAGEWPVRGLARLRDLGFHTAALALDPDALAVDDPRLREAPRLALLLGSEGDGLKRRTVASCDWAVRIPMSHGVDSLNVGAAAAVAFWETRRR